MLLLHRSERADRLVEALGDLLATPLADPVAPEVVSVPTRGVERWITQRLSDRLGVCANVEFPFPGSLVGAAGAAATGIDPAADPWSPERCAWRLVELLDTHLGDPRLAPLAAHLAASAPADARGEPGAPRRLTLARRVAGLYDHYALHRPELLLGWLDDDDGGWQGHLWRLARASLGAPSPAERLGPAVERLVAEPGLIDLPERLSVFGLTRLPASHLAVLSALATARDVHLWLLHPSGAWWDSVAAATRAAGPTGLSVREEDPTARVARHPLLRSWGRDAREMQVVLLTTTVDPAAPPAHAPAVADEHLPAGDDEHLPAGDDEHFPAVADEHLPAGDGTASLLSRLQGAVRADEPLPDDPGLLDPGDRSVQVHDCHGRARQVEVVRDSILHLLAEDPTLEARDVIVLCPDIEAFAPLVHAAFGADDPEGEDTGLPRLRVRLADRSLRQTNPMLSVAGALLDLAGSRVSASAVLDLAARPAVARRMRLDRDALTTLQGWVAGTGVRWGLDAAHRAPWRLDGVEANTWSAGLDRLLLGVAMAEEGGALFAGAVPYDDVPSTSVDLAGRVAELVSRLGTVLDGLTGPQPASAWAAALVGGTRLLAEPAPGDGWQDAQLADELTEATDRPDGLDPVLTLDEVRALLEHRLRGRPTRANFRTGDLTVCTLVPMRSVPHRVVVLMGLDDGAFPRHPEVDGDDLLAARPRVGDRDARSEDRQLLLDALLAATDHLVVTYSGRDERTNRRRPPAVPVAELLDVIDATVRLPDGRAAREQVVTRHPLQPWDQRTFTPGALGGEVGPWGYDRVQLAGARAAASPRPARPWLDGPLPPLTEPIVLLDHLVAFLENPVRAFLRQRLGLFLGRGDEAPADALPLDLSYLERWQVGDRLLRGRLAGLDAEALVAVERRRGALPPGRLADPLLDEIGMAIEALVVGATAAGFGPGSPPAVSVEVAVDLPDGRTLVGTVPNVHRAGPAAAVLECSYSRLAPKARLVAWARHLALCAARPDWSPTTTTVGRGERSKQPVSLSQLEPVAPAKALDLLMLLADLRDRGLRQPLPMACRTSAAWAAAERNDPDRARSDAESRWCTSPDAPVPGEDADAEHRLVWGTRAPLTRLLAEPAPPDETGEGWGGSPAHRFAALAHRLWDPLLDHERVLSPTGAG